MSALGSRPVRVLPMCAFTLALHAAIVDAQAPAASAPTSPSATVSEQLQVAARAVRDGDLQAARAALAQVSSLSDTLTPELEAQRSFQSAVVDQLEAEQDSANRQTLFENAAEGYQRVLKIKPGAVSALYNLGRIHEALGDLDRASKAYELASEPPGPDRQFYVQKRAEFLARRGRWKEAEETYTELVVLDARLEKPHTLLVERFVEQGKRGDTQPLLKYLWRLVQAGQSTRAMDSALDALRGGWPPADAARELLTVVAASLGSSTIAPRAFLESRAGRQLAALSESPTVGEGVRQLLALYRSTPPYALGFAWWNRGDRFTNPPRGVWPREAIRAAMRRLGRWYEENRDARIAAACYETAVNLNASDPDPAALRELATLYIDQGDLPAVNQLAARYANIEGAFFEAKSEAYRRGALEKVLEYHQTLGEIYGFLALNGKAAWGDSSRPTTAVFQLERAYRVSKTLDDRKPPVPTLGERASPLHLDPNLTDLLATAYAATGNAPRGNEVRLEAAKRFIDAGATRAKERVLEGVRQETLSDEQRLRYVDYKAAAPQAPVSRPGAKASVADTKRWRSDVEYVAKSVRPEKPADQPSGPAGTPPPSRHPGADVVVPRGDSRARRATEMASREGAVVEVPASAGWVDTGIDLPAGSALEISASGQWSNAGPPAKGPAGFEGYVYPGTVVGNAPLASLVGKVGEAMFAVGGNFRGRSPAAGRLYLSINDTPGTLADNQGSMRVTITVK